MIKAAVILSVAVCCGLIIAGFIVYAGLLVVAQRASPITQAVQAVWSWAMAHSIQCVGICLGVPVVLIFKVHHVLAAFISSYMKEMMDVHG